MHDTVAIADAKARFAEVVRRAESGETIVLTRHGRAVARLEPLRPTADATATASGRELREAERPYRAGRRGHRASGSRAVRLELLEGLLRDGVWPRVPKEQLGAGVGRRERERILGYGSDGV